jgi:hypothetical protein
LFIQLLTYFFLFFIVRFCFYNTIQYVDIYISLDSNSDSIILNHKDYPQLLNEIEHDYNNNENNNSQELSQLFDTIINDEELIKKLIPFKLTQGATESAVKSEANVEEMVSDNGNSNDRVIYYEEDKDIICILSDD